MEAYLPAQLRKDHDNWCGLQLVVPDGEFELRGGYVNMANLQEVSDYALSDEGTAVQTRLWVRDTFSHNLTCN